MRRSAGAAFCDDEAAASGSDDEASQDGSFASQAGSFIDDGPDDGPDPKRPRLAPGPPEGREGLPPVECLAAFTVDMAKAYTGGALKHPPAALDCGCGGCPGSTRSLCKLLRLNRALKASYTVDPQKGVRYGAPPGAKVTELKFGFAVIQEVFPNAVQLDLSSAWTASLAHALGAAGPAAAGLAAELAEFASVAGKQSLRRVVGAAAGRSDLEAIAAGKDALRAVSGYVSPACDTDAAGAVLRVPGWLRLVMRSAEGRRYLDCVYRALWVIAALDEYGDYISDDVLAAVLEEDHPYALFTAIRCARSAGVLTALWRACRWPPRVPLTVCRAGGCFV